MTYVFGVFMVAKIRKSAGFRCNVTGRLDAPVSDFSLPGSQIEESSLDTFITETGSDISDPCSRDGATDAPPERMGANEEARNELCSRGTVLEVDGEGVIVNEGRFSGPCSRDGATDAPPEWMGVNEEARNGICSRDTVLEVSGEGVVVNKGRFSGPCSRDGATDAPPEWMGVNEEARNGLCSRGTIL